MSPLASRSRSKSARVRVTAPFACLGYTSSGCTASAAAAAPRVQGTTAARLRRVRAELAPDSANSSSSSSDKTMHSGSCFFAAFPGLPRCAGRSTSADAGGIPSAAVLGPRERSLFGLCGSNAAC
eukprot:6190740-Pleurochrysis_carterae.AAC.2